MAGFLDVSSNAFTNAVGSRLKTIFNMGMHYDDLVNRSRAVGPTEASAASNIDNMDQALYYTLALADMTTKKYIAYYDKSYPEKREYLKNFALNPEIEFILDTLCDEAVTYDDKNYFAYPNMDGLKGVLKDEVVEEVLDKIDSNYKMLYNYFNFSDDITAWSYFKQFLVEGFLAFEIIYSEDEKHIIGFKELDAASLRPAMEQEDGKTIKVWYQYETVAAMKRRIYDSGIIYIAYSKNNLNRRVSYVERLLRSFNLLRHMENSRVIWYVMNSMYRLKMVVPIGSKSPQRAKESLQALMNVYKEEIQLDNDSGDLLYEGRPQIPYYKNYLFPNRNGEQVDIETIGGDGPDLSDTGALEYFIEKLRKDSKVPSSRFDKDDGNMVMGADGIDRDEIRFNKFITRLRSIFQELILKPLWIQTCLDFDEFKNDHLIKTNIGLTFVKDNIFEEIRQFETLQKRIEFIQSMQGILSDPEIGPDGMLSQAPYFTTSVLVDEYLKLDKEFVAENDKRKAELRKKNEKDLKKAQEAGMGGGMGMMGGMGMEGQGGQDDGMGGQMTPPQMSPNGGMAEPTTPRPVVPKKKVVPKT